MQNSHATSTRVIGSSQELNKYFLLIPIKNTLEGRWSRRWTYGQIFKQYK